MFASTDYWNGRRLAVTGATGFVGLHLARQLVAAGARVTALTRAGSATGRLRELGVECMLAPLDDRPALADAARGCEVLVHAAGAVDFGNDWDHCRRVNVEGTVNVLAAARAAGVRRVVHVSSIVAVGAARSPTVLDETAEWDLGRFEVPYVCTKRVAEERALGARAPEVVVVNPACIVGPDDYSSSEFGTLCKRFWRGRIPVCFGGGNNFVDVRDVAAGIMLAAERGRPGERYLLAGENLSFREFFALLARVAGRRYFRLRLPCFMARLGTRLAELFPKKKGRPYLTRPQARLLGLYFYFDSAKARRELGYRPRPVAESIADAYRFWTGDAARATNVVLNRGRTEACGPIAVTGPAGGCA